MLENFYKESDETAHHWRRSIALIFFAVAVYCGAAYIYFLYREDQSRQRLAAESREKNADAFCREIWLPPIFVLLERGETTNTGETTTVVYKYHSELKLEDIPAYRLRFIEQFDKAGWRSAGDRATIFQKGERRVSLLENEKNPANFELRCSETEISFGLYDL